MINYWPQVLMAVFIMIPIAMGIAHHGEISKRPIDGWNNAHITLWLALLLGMAGFWKF